MKKIGILTFHNTINYGAVLQALALEMKLKELGGDCEIVNYHCENIEKRENIKFPKYEKNVMKYLKNLKSYLLLSSKRKKIQQFIEKNILLSNKEYTKSNIKEANDIYDKFIVGSDMVLNLDITNRDTTYYLDFADSNKRYSYAASFGNYELKHEYHQDCINYLNSFQHISLRENQSKEYLSKILNNKIYVDVDPTLLYDGKFWEKYEKKPNIKISKKYILLYFLDKNKIELKTAKKIAKEKNYEIIILHHSRKKERGCRYLSNLKIEEFLYLIHHAELVITGSFHGMVFAMNYNTNFMYYNLASSNRLENIAIQTKSQDRKLTENYIPPILCNFDVINKSLEKIRNNSIKYLKEIVNKDGD